jgi:hypothetical protein
VNGSGAGVWQSPPAPLSVAELAAREQQCEREALSVERRLRVILRRLEWGEAELAELVLIEDELDAKLAEAEAWLRLRQEREPAPVVPRAAGRFANGCRFPGEHNSSAMLTWSQVAEIRRRYQGRQPAGRPRRGASRPAGSLEALAREFGVSRNTIANIVKGRRWTAA